MVEFRLRTVKNVLDSQISSIQSRSEQYSECHSASTPIVFGLALAAAGQIPQCRPTIVYNRPIAYSIRRVLCWFFLSEH